MLFHPKQLVLYGHNLDRRQLNDFQKGLLGKELLKIEKEEAKQRQGTRNDLSTLSISMPNVNKHERSFSDIRKTKLST